MFCGAFIESYSAAIALLRRKSTNISHRKILSYSMSCKAVITDIASNSIANQFKQ